MNRSVRIADVAKEAGVSTTAVSFAFNNPHRLNQQTVIRILEVARRLGYAPSPHARALLTKTVGAIGVLVPQTIPAVFANPFFSMFYEGVGQICEENGLSLLTVSPVGGSLSKAVANAPVDGFIVVGLDEIHEDIEVLNKRNIPFVIVDGDSVLGPSVNIEDEKGAWLAADLVLSMGHRKILCMTFEIDYYIHASAKRRLSGFRRAFEAHGIPWSEEEAIPAAVNIAAGAEIFTAAWGTSNHSLTAVLGVSDIAAVGVLQAARELGLKVPDDLSVIGYDDITMASWTEPPLTTIHQPIVEKGETAAQILVSLIAGETNISKITLPTELMLRGTVGTPKGGEAQQH